MIAIQDVLAIAKPALEGAAGGMLGDSIKAVTLRVLKRSEPSKDAEGFGEGLECGIALCIGAAALVGLGYCWGRGRRRASI